MNVTATAPLDIRVSMWRMNCPPAHVVYLLCWLLTYCAEFLVVIIASTYIIAGHPFLATSVHEHHFTVGFNQGLVIHSALLNYVNQ